jgi:hypothetical protein
MMKSTENQIPAFAGISKMLVEANFSEEEAAS